MIHIALQTTEQTMISAKMQFGDTKSVGYLLYTCQKSSSFNWHTSDKNIIMSNADTTDGLSKIPS